jgi:MFS family permease
MKRAVSSSAARLSKTPFRGRTWSRQSLQSLRRVIAPGPIGATESNARNLCLEIFWAGFLTAAASFNAPFALRLGATNDQIGLLSSIPALLAIVVTIPAGRFFSQRSRRMPWVTGALFVYRLGYLLVALIPWLPVAQRGTVLIWVLILFMVPAHFFGVGWSSMMADVVPEINRARVFALRNILVAVVVTASTFAAGRWLERIAFPINYQVLYIAGFGTSMVSVYYILQVRVPDSVVVAREERQRSTPRQLVQSAREAFRSQPDFVRLVINTFAHGLGLWMIGPVYVLYYVRGLGATEGWIGLNGTLASLTPIIGFYLWQRAVRRWGENRVLRRTIIFVGLYPVLVGLSPGLTPILFWTALNGLLTPGVTLSHFPMLLKICPAAQRPMYLGLYTTLMNLGAFVMPMLGVSLANRFGFQPVLIAGGLMCLAGSSLFAWRPLQTPDSLALRQRTELISTGGIQ